MKTELKGKKKKREISEGVVFVFFSFFFFPSEMEKKYINIFAGNGMQGVTYISMFTVQNEVEF